jgi:nickel-dependent lactate racemase
MSIRTLHLPFGHSEIEIDIETSNLLDILLPRRNSEVVDESRLIYQALAYPTDSPRLSDLAQKGQKVVVITSDMTRPCPSERLLPPVLAEIDRGGVPDSDITVVMALGLHRPMSSAELEAAVGADIYRRVQVVNHDPKDVVRLGTTLRGTPVDIFRPVVEAEFRICLGNLELHYFAGYSGGAKAILPGCASRAAIQANHAMMVSPEADAGRLQGNPVRADIEEGVAMLGVDFILNVVVDEQHRVVGAFAGEVTAAHRLGCEFVARKAKITVPRLADIVIAECSEGLGNRTFERWMREADSPDELLTRLQRTFELGGHKAAAIASVLKRATVLLVSALPDELAQTCGLVPCPDLDTALADAVTKIGSNASLIVMPQGGAVLPEWAG